MLAAVDVDPLRFEPQAGEEFYRQLVDRVSRLPGVVTAGFAPRGVVTGQVGRDTLTRIWVSGVSDDGTSQVAFCVSPRLLDAVAVRVLQGRGFTAAGSVGQDRRRQHGVRRQVPGRASQSTAGSGSAAPQAHRARAVSLLWTWEGRAGRRTGHRPNRRTRTAPT